MESFFHFRAAACLGLLLWSAAPALEYQYLELRAPSTAPGAAPDANPIPVYLAFPDSLGPIGVKAFLEAPPAKVRTFFQGGSLHLRPVSPAEKRFLAALRDLVDGRMNEAKEGLAMLAKQKLPPSLRSCLRIDAALLLYLANLPGEAEKDWLQVLKSADPAAEGAWRNLFSLYMTRREFTKANGLVEDALQGSPRNKWANLAKGYLLRMLRSDAEWEAFLKAKSSWKDSLFGIQIAYGKFLYDRGQWKEAIKYYNRGLEGSPANGPVWLDLAEAYYKDGDPIASEQCIHNAFRFGIDNPRVFELYGLVLQDLAEVFQSMPLVYRGFREEIREYHREVDASRIRAILKRAEQLLEEGFKHDLHSRSMAQLLYHLYLSNGRTEAARNLREGFWFHFTGPSHPGRPVVLSTISPPPDARLSIPLSEITFPLVMGLRRADFFEAFPDPF